MNTAGRSMQDALREAARQSQTIAFLVGEVITMRQPQSQKPGRGKKRARPSRWRWLAKQRRKEVRTMGKSDGKVPEKTPERTPEESPLSGGEQSNGPVKG